MPLGLFHSFLASRAAAVALRKFCSASISRTSSIANIVCCARFIAAPCGSAFDFSNPFKNTEISATIASDRLAFPRSKCTISSRMLVVTSEECNLAYPSVAHHQQKRNANGVSTSLQLTHRNGARSACIADAREPVPSEGCFKTVTTALTGMVTSSVCPCGKRRKQARPEINL